MKQDMAAAIRPKANQVVSPDFLKAQPRSHGRKPNVAVARTIWYLPRRPADEQSLSLSVRNKVVGSNTHLTGFRHSHYDSPP